MLANLSISEDVGPSVAANEQFLSLLLGIIGEAKKKKIGVFWVSFKKKK